MYRPQKQIQQFKQLTKWQSESDLEKGLSFNSVEEHLPSMHKNTQIQSPAP